MIGNPLSGSVPPSPPVSSVCDWLTVGADEAVGDWDEDVVGDGEVVCCTDGLSLGDGSAPGVLPSPCVHQTIAAVITATRSPIRLR
jgi:hypothetical protein